MGGTRVQRSGLHSSGVLAWWGRKRGRASHGVAIALALAVLAGTAAVQAAEEGLRELTLPSVLVESEVGPDLGFEAPPPSYPLQKVQQLPYHGAWHGFVNTTTGGLVFRVVDLKLPGRMPIEFSRIYDSKISLSMPPAPPGRGTEQRTTADLGQNWIPNYASYLIQTSIGYDMATVDGYIVKWEDQGNDLYLMKDSVPSPHLRLDRINATTLVETRLDGTKWTFTNGNGYAYALTKIEDRSGNFILITYTSGYISRVENSDDSYFDIMRPLYQGGTPAYPNTRITSVTDSTGRVVEFEYDANGMLIEATDVRGFAWDYGYDSAKKLISATDPEDDVYLTATYDGAFRTRTYAANDGSWTFSYYFQDDETKVKDAFDNLWIYEHHPNGMPHKITEPTGGVHELVLDSYRNPIAYNGPEGESSSWTYNAQHRPLTYTPPGTGSNTITYAYDATNGWVDSVTALSGGVRTFTRDAAGRVLEEVAPDGGEWTATYSATNGDRLTLTLPKGNAPGGSGYEWSFGCDSFGQITSATDPTGRVFEFEYTAAGDLHKFRKPDHRVDGVLVYSEWTYTRDASGRITAIEDPLGHIWTRVYDDAGRLTEQHGPAGTTVEYGYDAYHRMTSAALIDGVSDPTTTYAFDAAGRMVSKTLPTGSTWTYSYDTSSRLIGTTDPLDRTWTYVRDLSGRVESITYPGGQEVTLARDNAGRLTTRTIPGGRVETFGYDPGTGRLTSAEVNVGAGDWIGTIEWDHDAMDRPTAITTTVDDGTESLMRTLTYTYDLNGNRTGLVSTPVGETLTYAYDELDRLIETDSDIHDDWSVLYDDDSGHRTAADSDSRSKQWLFDPAGKITEETWDWPGGGAQFSYAYDVEGRTTSFADAISGLDVDLEYNDLGLLSLFERHDDTTLTKSEAYTYDAAGQLEKKVEDPAVGPTVTMYFEWDAAGRLVAASHNNDMRLYTWDDDPAEPGVALKISRVATDPHEPNADLLYGFDGRLEEVWAYPKTTDVATLIGQYRWSPLVTDLVFEARDRVAEDTYDERSMAMDVGGYYAELDAAFDDLDLRNPVLVADVAGRSLGAREGVSVPDPIAPFALGQWEAMFRPAAAEPALAGFATGFIRGRVERGIAGVEEQRGLRSLEALDRFTPAPADLYDDWLEAPLVGGPSMGDRAQLLSMAGATARESGWAESVLDGWTPEGGMSPHGTGIGTQGGLCLCGAWDTTPVFNPGGGGELHLDCCDGGIYENEGVPEPAPFCEFPFAYSDALYVASIRYEDVSEGGVSLVNGEFSHQETDLVVFAPSGDVDFTRSYRSLFDYTGPLGPHWTHNWLEFVEVVGPECTGTSSCTVDCPGDGSSGCTVTCDGEVEFVKPQARWVSRDGRVEQFSLETDGSSTGDPTSLYRLKRVDSLTYQVRQLSGEVHEFKRVPGLGEYYYQLTKITHGTNVTELVYDTASPMKLVTIRTNDQDRVSLEWDGSKLHLVRNALDVNDLVEYEYDTGGRLTNVYRPTPALAPEVSIPNHPKTTTRYAYTNVNDGITIGASLLESIEVEQYSPLTTGPLVFEWVLQNKYGITTGIASNVVVTKQCLNHASCDAEPIAWDLNYEYEHGQHLGDHYTDVIDKRHADGDVTTRHTFLGNHLYRLTEDQDGPLARTTEYQYTTSGLLTLTKFPDGRCEELKYADVAGGVSVAWLTRQMTKESCLNSVPDATDLVTVRTFHQWNGAVASVTGPEAFTGVSVPTPWWAFDPHWGAFKPFTTFYTYDFEEAGSAAGMGCGLWGLPCGSGTTDLNGDEVTGQFFGRLIKQTRYDPTHATDLSVTYSYDVFGRPRWKKNAAGVKVEQKYYNDPTDDWDWRDGSTLGAVNAPGPLAQTVVRASDLSATIETQRIAWSPRLETLAVRNTLGVVTETERATDGRVLREWTCRLENDEPNCGAVPDAQLLRTTDTTYDLRGRVLKSRAFDAQDQELGEEWFTYDARGNLATSTVDPDPAVTAGFPSSSTTYLHLLSRSEHDELGRVVRTVSPAGRVSCQSYDALNRPDRTWQLAAPPPGGGLGACPAPDPEDDPLTTVTYDVMDRVTAVKDPDGEETFTWYDAHGRPEYVSDGLPGSPAVVFEPPSSGPGPGNWWSQSSYDKASRVTRAAFFGRPKNIPGEANEPGYLSVAWNEFDTLGRLERTRVGIADTFIPDPPLDPPSDPEDFEVATTTTLYDTAGRKRAVRDPLGRETTVEYDVFGRAYRTLMPAARLVCWSGQTATTTSCSTAADCPANHSCALSAASLTHRDKTETLYDTLTGQVDEQVSTLYDPTWVAHTRRQQVSYDAWGRTRRVLSDPGGAERITDFTYDARGLRTEQAERWAGGDVEDPADPDPNDRVTQWEFDAAGRVTERRTGDPANWTRTQSTYDDDGAMLSMKDANNSVTSWEYDPGLGRLHQMLYPLTDGKRQVVRFPEYDLSGRPQRVAFGEGIVESGVLVDPPSAAWLEWTLGYDDQGRLTSRTATPPVGTGVPTFFGATYQEFQYDDLGRMTRSLDQSADDFPGASDIEVLYQYDTAGRLLLDNQRLPVGADLDDHKVESTYLLDGFRSVLEFPVAHSAPEEEIDDRYRIEYRADGRGRLRGILAPTSSIDPLNTAPARDLLQLVGFEHLGGSMWSRSNVNGTTENLAFDGLGRVESLTASFDTTDFLDYRFGYDRVGNLSFEQRQHEPMGTTPATYRTRAHTTNLLGQLTKWSEGALPLNPIEPDEDDPASLIASPPGVSATWTLDGLGNWSSQTPTEGGTAVTRAINPLNQYTSVQTGSNEAEDLVHDWLGNLRVSEPRNQRYVWDAFGRLTQVKDLGTDALIAQYRYDAHNRRVEKHVPLGVSGLDTLTARYIYDGWRAIEERALQTTGQEWWEAVRARYGFGASLDDVLWMDRDVALVDQQPDPIGATDGVIDSRFFVHQDLRSSAAALTSDSTSPAVVERYTYGAYGETKVWSGAAWQVVVGYSSELPASKYGFTSLYTGQRLDAETGLYYYKNRFYDPQDGRFLSRDPIGLAGGISLYEYGKSNPAVFVDPLGLDTEEGQRRHRLMSGSLAYDSRNNPQWSKDRQRDKSGWNVGGIGLSVEFRDGAERDAYYERGRRDQGRGRNNDPGPCSFWGIGWPIDEYIKVTPPKNLMEPDPVDESGRPRMRGLDGESAAAISRGGKALLLDDDIARIIFNETRSLSGDGLNAARAAIANTIINADEYWGSKRELHADTAPATLPKEFTLSEIAEMASIESVVAAVRVERAAGIDGAAGATNFNMRKELSTRPPNWAPTLQSQAIYGPYSNTLGPATYINTWYNPTVKY